MHNLYFTEQNVEYCIDLSSKYTKYWGNLNAFLRSHTYWHYSLFFVEKMQIDKALSIFEDHLWNFED